MSKPRPYGLGPYGADSYERWGQWKKPPPCETGVWAPFVMTEASGRTTAIHGAVVLEEETAR
jgi:hypothetical protein